MMAGSPLILTVLLVLAVSTVVKSEEEIQCSKEKYEQCLMKYPFMPEEQNLIVPYYSLGDLDEFCIENYFNFKRCSADIRMGCFTVERLLLDGLRKSFDYACEQNVDFTYKVFPNNCVLPGDSGDCGDILKKYHSALEEMSQSGISKKYRREHSDAFCEAVDKLKECQDHVFGLKCDDEDLKTWMSEMHDLRHEPLLNELSCLDTVLETWLIVCILIAAVFMIFIMVICVCSMRSAKEDEKTLIE